MQFQVQYDGRESENLLRLTPINDPRSRRYSIKSPGYIRFAVSKAPRPIRRLAARASTSSPPFVRTTLNGQSSANIGLTLLKRSRGGRSLFHEKEIAGPVEL